MFETLSFPFFTEFFNLYYVEGIKRIPSNIFDFLSPVGLAFWYIDSKFREN